MDDPEDHSKNSDKSKWSGIEDQSDFRSQEQPIDLTLGAKKRKEESRPNVCSPSTAEISIPQPLASGSMVPGMAEMHGQWNMLQAMALGGVQAQMAMAHEYMKWASGSALLDPTMRLQFMARWQQQAIAASQAGILQRYQETLGDASHTRSSPSRYPAEESRDRAGSHSPLSTLPGKATSQSKINDYLPCKKKAKSVTDISMKCSDTKCIPSSSSSKKNTDSKSKEGTRVRESSVERRIESILRAALEKQARKDEKSENDDMINGKMPTQLLQTPTHTSPNVSKFQESGAKQTSPESRDTSSPETPQDQCVDGKMRLWQPWGAESAAKAMEELAKSGVSSLQMPSYMDKQMMSSERRESTIGDDQAYKFEEWKEQQADLNTDITEMEKRKKYIVEKAAAKLAKSASNSRRSLGMHNMDKKGRGKKSKSKEFVIEGQEPSADKYRYSETTTNTNLRKSSDKPGLNALEVDSSNVTEKHNMKNLTCSTGVKFENEHYKEHCHRDKPSKVPKRGLANVLQKLYSYHSQKSESEGTAQTAKPLTSSYPCESLGSSKAVVEQTRSISAKSSDTLTDQETDQECVRPIDTMVQEVKEQDSQKVDGKDRCEEKTKTLLTGTCESPLSDTGGIEQLIERKDFVEAHGNKSDNQFLSITGKEALGQLNLNGSDKVTSYTDTQDPAAVVYDVPEMCSSPTEKLATSQVFQMPSVMISPTAKLLSAENASDGSSKHKLKLPEPTVSDLSCAAGDLGSHSHAVSPTSEIPHSLSIAELSEKPGVEPEIANDGAPVHEKDDDGLAVSDDLAEQLDKSLSISDSCRTVDLEPQLINKAECVEDRVIINPVSKTQPTETNKKCSLESLGVNNAETKGILKDKYIHKKKQLGPRCRRKIDPGEPFCTDIIVKCDEENEDIADKENNKHGALKVHLCRLPLHSVQGELLSFGLKEQSKMLKCKTCSVLRKERKFSFQTSHEEPCADMDQQPCVPTDTLDEKQSNVRGLPTMPSAPLVMLSDSSFQWLLSDDIQSKKKILQKSNENDAPFFIKGGRQSCNKEENSQKENQEEEVQPVQKFKSPADNKSIDKVKVLSVDEENEGKFEHFENSSKDEEREETLTLISSGKSDPYVLQLSDEEDQTLKFEENLKTPEAETGLEEETDKSIKTSSANDKEENVLIHSKDTVEPFKERTGMSTKKPKDVLMTNQAKSKKGRRNVQDVKDDQHAGFEKGTCSETTECDAEVLNLSARHQEVTLDVCEMISHEVDSGQPPQRSGRTKRDAHKTESKRHQPAGRRKTRQSARGVNCEGLTEVTDTNEPGSTVCVNKKSENSDKSEPDLKWPSEKSKTSVKRKTKLGSRLQLHCEGTNDLSSSCDDSEPGTSSDQCLSAPLESIKDIQDLGKGQMNKSCMDDHKEFQMDQSVNESVETKDRHADNSTDQRLTRRQKQQIHQSDQERGNTRAHSRLQLSKMPEKEKETNLQKKSAKSKASSRYVKEINYDSDSVSEEELSLVSSQTSKLGRMAKPVVSEFADREDTEENKKPTKTDGKAKIYATRKRKLSSSQSEICENESGIKINIDKKEGTAKKTKQDKSKAVKNNKQKKQKEVESTESSWLRSDSASSKNKTDKETKKSSAIQEKDKKMKGRQKKQNNDDEEFQSSLPEGGQTQNNQTALANQELPGCPKDTSVLPHAQENQVTSFVTGHSATGIQQELSQSQPQEGDVNNRIGLAVDNEMLGLVAHETGLSTGCRQTVSALQHSDMLPCDLENVPKLKDSLSLPIIDSSEENFEKVPEGEKLYIPPSSLQKQFPNKSGLHMASNELFESNGKEMADHTSLSFPYNLNDSKKDLDIQKENEMNDRSSLSLVTGNQDKSVASTSPYPYIHNSPQWNLCQSEPNQEAFKQTIGRPVFQPHWPKQREYHAGQSCANFQGQSDNQTMRNTQHGQWRAPAPTNYPPSHHYWSQFGQPSHPPRSTGPVDWQHQRGPRGYSQVTPSVWNQKQQYDNNQGFTRYQYDSYPTETQRNPACEMGSGQQVPVNVHPSSHPPMREQQLRPPVPGSTQQALPLDSDQRKSPPQAASSSKKRKNIEVFVANSPHKIEELPELGEKPAEHNIEKIANKAWKPTQRKRQTKGRDVPTAGEVEATNVRGKSQELVSKVEKPGRKKQTRKPGVDNRAVIKLSAQDRKLFKKFQCKNFNIILKPLSLAQLNYLLEKSRPANERKTVQKRNKGGQNKKERKSDGESVHSSQDSDSMQSTNEKLGGLPIPSFNSTTSVPESNWKSRIEMDAMPCKQNNQEFVNRSVCSHVGVQPLNQPAQPKRYDKNPASAAQSSALSGLVSFCDENQFNKPLDSPTSCLSSSGNSSAQGSWYESGPHYDRGTKTTQRHFPEFQNQTLDQTWVQNSPRHQSGYNSPRSEGSNRQTPPYSGHFHQGGRDYYPPNGPQYSPVQQWPPHQSPSRYSPCNSGYQTPPRHGTYYQNQGTSGCYEPPSGSGFQPPSQAGYSVHSERDMIQNQMQKQLGYQSPQTGPPQAAAQGVQNQLAGDQFDRQQCSSITQSPHSFDVAGNDLRQGSGLRVSEAMSRQHLGPKDNHEDATFITMPGQSTHQGDKFGLEHGTSLENIPHGFRPPGSEKKSIQETMPGLARLLAKPSPSYSAEVVTSGMSTAEPRGRIPAKPMPALREALSSPPKYQSPPPHVQSHLQHPQQTSQMQQSQHPLSQSNQSYFKTIPSESHQQIPQSQDRPKENLFQFNPSPIPNKQNSQEYVSNRECGASSIQHTSVERERSYSESEYKLPSDSSFHASARQNTPCPSFSDGVQTSSNPARQWTVDGTGSQSNDPRVYHMNPPASTAALKKRGRPKKPKELLDGSDAPIPKRGRPRKTVKLPDGSVVMCSQSTNSPSGVLDKGANPTSVPSQYLPAVPGQETNTSFPAYYGPHPAVSMPQATFSGTNSQDYVRPPPSQGGSSFRHHLAGTHYPGHHQQPVNDNCQMRELAHPGEMGGYNQNMMTPFGGAHQLSVPMPESQEDQTEDMDSWFVNSMGLLSEGLF